MKSSALNAEINIVSSSYNLQKKFFEECFENKWFYMKYIGKYLSAEILLTRECTNDDVRLVPK
jgi:hypothetical protein